MSRKLDIDKMGVAERQINTSIRILFNKEDPIPIHTIISAGLRILRDIAKHRKISYEGLIDQVIKPDKRKEFWSKISSPANFFKHADRDHNDILKGVDEQINDMMIFISISYYECLNGDISIEMKAFKCWFMMCHPNVFSDEVAVLIEKFGFTDFIFLSRDEKLSKGLDAIEASKYLWS